MTATGDTAAPLPVRESPGSRAPGALDASWRAGHRAPRILGSGHTALRRGDGRLDVDGRRTEVRGAISRCSSRVRARCASCSRSARTATRSAALRVTTNRWSSRRRKADSWAPASSPSRSSRAKEPIATRAWCRSSRRGFGQPRTILRAIGTAALAAHARGDARSRGGTPAAAQLRSAMPAPRPRSPRPTMPGVASGCCCGNGDGARTPRHALPRAPATRSSARTTSASFEGTPGLFPVQLLARARSRGFSRRSAARKCRRCCRSAATWKCAASSAIAPGASMPWTSQEYSRRGRRGRRRGVCTSRLFPLRRACSRSWRQGRQASARPQARAGAARRARSSAWSCDRLRDRSPAMDASEGAADRAIPTNQLAAGDGLARLCSFVPARAGEVVEARRGELLGRRERCVSPSAGGQPVTQAPHEPQGCLPVPRLAYRTFICIPGAGNPQPRVAPH